jgi:hypothetical protein
MNPFDEAPSTPAVSFDPPSSLAQPPRRRGRTALVALAAAGLMGVGLVGVSQFASAERATVSPPAGDETVGVPVPDTADLGDDRDDGADEPVVDGKIVINNGDGAPIVIDLGEGTVDGQPFGQIAECLGLPDLAAGPMFGGDLEGLLEDIPFGDLEGMLEDLSFDDLEGMFEDFPLSELEGMLEDFTSGVPGDHRGGMPLDHFGLFGSDGTHVSVMGPDGVSMVELGDGDGSVTITQKDGTVTIETDGSATVKEIGDLLGGIEWSDSEGIDIAPLFPDDFEGFDFELPSDIQACLDGAVNG